VDAAVVAQMLAVNDKLAGIMADQPDPGPAPLYLTASGPGFCLHESLAEHSDRTRRLLDHVRAVGAADGTEMTGDDLVHLDFHPGNVLVDGAGTVTGIIDWDGAARGDRRFDLVTLRFAIPPGQPALAARLDADIAARLTVDELRPYWASMALRQVDWAIRHHDAGTVERYLTIAEIRVD
jgi:aminoglycoside phosphotransferase (APT) family kinase protein